MTEESGRCLLVGVTTQSRRSYNWKYLLFVDAVTRQGKETHLQTPCALLVVVPPQARVPFPPSASPGHIYCLFLPNVTRFPPNEPCIGRGVTLSMSFTLHHREQCCGKNGHDSFLGRFASVEKGGGVMRGFWTVAWNPTTTATAACVIRPISKTHHQHSLI